MRMSNKKIYKMEHKECGNACGNSSKSVKRLKSREKYRLIFYIHL